MALTIRLSEKEENSVMSIVKRIALVICLVGALALMAAAQQQMNTSVAGATGGAQEMKKSLYQRLGGYDAVAAVVDDFIGRLVADKKFSKFFVGHSTDSLKKIRQHIVDQFCNAAGGPCLYTGRDMKTTHAGLGISE